MNPFENPFYVLGASPRDSRRRLSALAEERAFLSDSEAVNEARSALVIPQKRLAAEMRWFPGVGDETVKEILDDLQKAQEERGSFVFPEVDDGIHLIASFNSAIYQFCARRLGNVSETTASILAIDEQFDGIDTWTFNDELNEDREAAGFPAAEESEIEEEFRNYQSDIVKALDGKLATLPLGKNIELALELAKSYADEKSIHRDSPLLGGLLDEYELRVAPQMEELKQAIFRVAANVNANIDTLSLLIKKWGGLSQPLHLVARRRGLEHGRVYKDSEEILFAVRHLAIELHNKHNRTKDALKLTQALKGISVSMNTFRNLLEEDAKTLNSIIQGKEKIAKKTAQKRKIQMVVWTIIAFFLLIGWLRSSDGRLSSRRSISAQPASVIPSRSQTPTLNEMLEGIKEIPRPSYQIQTIRQRRAALDAQMRPLGVQIEKMKKELDEMETRLNKYKADIEQREAQYKKAKKKATKTCLANEIKKYTSQHNALVGKYNALLEKYKSDVSRYNSLVDEYNSLR